MKIIRHSAILAAVVCGTTVSADVTAQQVWDKWSAQMDVYGDGFSTSGETMSGDTLTVADVVINMSDDEAAVTANIGDITLTENGDGTVSVVMAKSYPVTFNVTPDGVDPSTVNITVAHDNMVLLVSGDPEAMVFDLAADRYAMTIDSIEGEAANNVTLQDGMVAMINVVGQYSVREDNLTRIGYDFSVGALDVDLDLSGIEGDGYVKATADIADLAMSALIAAPIDMDLNADQPPFADGLAFEGGYSFGAVNYDFDINMEGEQVAGNASVDSGVLDMAFDIDRASYIGETQGLNVAMSVPAEFPFPIEVSMAKYGFDIQLPLSQGDDGGRDARMAFNFTELAVGDTLWNLGDPQNILPRDPFTIALDLDAVVTPFFNFLDPAQQEAAMLADVPGELNSLEINALTIRGAGVEIATEGSFVFDNSDLQTFDGFPRPEGAVTVAINGANGLIDKLIQMGIVPQEEAMMPRMMMGMFTTPIGDDQLTSTLEINAEGHVLANGQRLR